MDEFSIEIRLMQLMKEYGITKEKAVQMYKDLLIHQQNELKEHLGEKTYGELREIFSSANKLTPEQLEEEYYKLTKAGELIPAQIIKATEVYLETEDFIGEKELFPGTALELNKSWNTGEQIVEVWLAPRCCTYVDADSISIQ